MMYSSIVINTKAERTGYAESDCVNTNFINHVTAIDDAICTSTEFRKSYNRGRLKNHATSREMCFAFYARDRCSAVPKLQAHSALEIKRTWPTT